MKRALNCKNGHVFGDKAKFEKCPFCGSPVYFSWSGYEEKLKNYFLRRTSKTEIHDSLPRLPWFNEMIAGTNNPSTKKSGEKWSLDEVYNLLKKFKEYGIGDEKLWKDIAENVFGRSLCAVEHILRFVVAADMDMVNLNEIFG